MYKRFAGLLALLFSLSLVPAASATAGTPFFGHARPHVGQEFSNLHLTSKIVAKHVTVREVGNGTVSGTATIRTAEGVLHTDFEWHGHCNWSFTVRPHQHQHLGTDVSPGNIHGAISAEDCAHHARLRLHDYVIGDARVDIALHAVPGHGFEGSTHVSDLRIGDVHVTNATVAVSTLSPAARVTGDLESDLGSFTADLGVAGKPGDYQISVNVTGADLNIEGRGFHFKEFTFSTNYHKNAHDHSVASAHLSGSVRMKHATYTMHHGHVKLVGGVLKELAFDIEIVHTSGGVTYTGRLKLELDRDGGQFTQMYSTSNSNGPTLFTQEATYEKALVGQVTMTKTRQLKKKIAGRTFERGVTIGLTFGVAIYSVDGSNFHSYIGAGGGFDASRVSGAFGCWYGTHDSDFSCLGTLRLNPPWAGIRRVQWTV